MTRWNEIIAQIDDSLGRLANVDWNNAFCASDIAYRLGHAMRAYRYRYDPRDADALTGSESSDEMADNVGASIEIAQIILAKYRPTSEASTPAPAPTCINALSFTSLPDFIATNSDALKLRGVFQQAHELIGLLQSVDWAVATENFPVCEQYENTTYGSSCVQYGRSHEQLFDRDDSDEFNIQILGPIRDFLHVVVQALPEEPFELVR